MTSLQTIEEIIQRASPDLIDSLLREALGRKVFEVVRDSDGNLEGEYECTTEEAARAAIAKGPGHYRIENGKPNVQAATALLDRGYGKPAQAVVTKDKDGAVQPITGITYIIPQPEAEE